MKHIKAKWTHRRTCLSTIITLLLKKRFWNCSRNYTRSVASVITIYDSMLFLDVYYLRRLTFAQNSKSKSTKGCWVSRSTFMVWRRIFSKSSSQTKTVREVDSQSTSIELTTRLLRNGFPSSLTDTSHQVQTYLTTGRKTYRNFYPKIDLNCRNSTPNMNLTNRSLMRKKKLLL